MRNERVDCMRALLLQEFGGARDGVGGIGQVVDEDGGSVGDVSDEEHGGVLAVVEGCWTAFLSDRIRLVMGHLRSARVRVQWHRLRERRKVELHSFLDLLPEDVKLSEPHVGYQ